LGENEMGQIWDAFSRSYKEEGLTGAKTPQGGKAYAFETGYDIGTTMKISGFEIGYVGRRCGLNNQQVLVVLSNLKFQRYFVNNGSLNLYNTYETENARSRLLGKRIKEWLKQEGLEVRDIPARASYQAANPSDKDKDEVIRYGGSNEWIAKEGGEAKDWKPDISLPSMPAFPSLGGDFGGVKQSLQVTGVVLMAFVALVIYIMFVKGGAGREVHVG